MFFSTKFRLYIGISPCVCFSPLPPPSPSRLLLCNPACTEHRAANHHGDSGHPSHNAEPCVKWVTSHSSPEARASEAGAQNNPFSLCRIRVSEIRLPLAAWVPRLKVCLLKQSIWLTTKHHQIHSHVCSAPLEMVRLTFFFCSGSQTFPSVIQGVPGGPFMAQPMWPRTTPWHNSQHTRQLSAVLQRNTKKRRIRNQGEKPVYWRFP